jgi:hypothetical protein
MMPVSVYPGSGISVICLGPSWVPVKPKGSADPVPPSVWIVKSGGTAVPSPV